MRLLVWSTHADHVDTFYSVYNIHGHVLLYSVQNLLEAVYNTFLIFVYLLMLTSHIVVLCNN